MSAAIGGRSEGIGAAPDTNISQQTTQIKEKVALNVEEQQEFKDLNDEELKSLQGLDAESQIIPFGARLGNLLKRSNFLQGLSNKFIGAPSGANVGRKEAEQRIIDLNNTIATAKIARDKNNQNRIDTTNNLPQRFVLLKSGRSFPSPKIASGSPLDIAFTNKSREINNIISQAEAEKQGILLQTSTETRKKEFGKFRVITDKRNGKGRNRGVFDTSGNIGNARQASLFEALGTLNRVLGLIQNNGKRGSNTRLKASVGALNKVQNQRLEAQSKSRDKLNTKLTFEKELSDISGSGTLTQKEKRNQIFAAARRRDEGLKTKIVTNTQFEQSRAGFAAARTNIVSGNNVRFVQDFIDLGREKRRKARLGDDL